ncbi:MAG: NAD(P)H-dependent glycerol-3-phosphate dehydrogenase [Bacilli bacterium]
MKKVLVVGAGSWGTALSMVLADNDYDVTIWGNNTDQLKEIQEQHTNKRYLPEIVLSDRIGAEADIKIALEHIEDILIVVPTSAVRAVAKVLAKNLNKPVRITHASKGIEPGTFKRISEMIAEEIPAELIKDIVVLSGPSHAEEVALRQPTTVSAASANMEAAEYVQHMFSNDYFRVYTSPDMVGVEIGGALKNIIAIAAGMTDGLGYGDNARAALITRGLAEITRLGVKLGANPLTFAGLTGVGDLIVTCTSKHSRNWRCGYALAQGESLDKVLENMGMVVEGVHTISAAYELAQRENVELPITFALYKVLFENLSPTEGVGLLMNRMRTHETVEFYNSVLGK